MRRGIPMLRSLVAIALALCLATAATAQGVPSPGNATIPAVIRLVGQDAFGTIDPSGTFTVTLRDLANNPIPYAIIRVEFVPCASASLCPSQGASVTSVNCDASGLWVEGVTGPDGSWSASIAGCSKGGPLPSSGGCARIYGKGVLLGYPRTAILDLSGCDGVGANDLSVWLVDFVSGLDPQRSDYDGTGSIGANDLSLWLNAYGSAGSALNCSAAACP